MLSSCFLLSVSGSLIAVIWMAVRRLKLPESSLRTKEGHSTWAEHRQSVTEGTGTTDMTQRLVHFAKATSPTKRPESKLRIKQQSGSKFTILKLTNGHQSIKAVVFLTNCRSTSFLCKDQKNPTHIKMRNFGVLTGFRDISALFSVFWFPGFLSPSFVEMWSWTLPLTVCTRRVKSSEWTARISLVGTVHWVQRQRSV